MSKAFALLAVLYATSISASVSCDPGEPIETTDIVIEKIGAESAERFRDGEYDYVITFPRAYEGLSFEYAELLIGKASLAGPTLISPLDVTDSLTALERWNGPATGDRPVKKIRARVFFRNWEEPVIVLAYYEGTSGCKLLQRSLEKIDSGAGKDAAT